jgi:DNA-binding NtrC family response regulator
VLIIDHQANYRRTLHEKFRLLGFTPHSHTDYQSGFAALKSGKTPITGVFIDVVPGLRESLRFIKELRQFLGPSGLIFVMSNVPSARDYRNEFKSTGASEFFEKPLHADNFNFIVRQLDAACGFAAPDKLAA